MTARESDWTIEAADGLEIVGSTHEPEAARLCVLLLHGFKGYKDYGFIPVLGAHLSRRGAVVHRFNFSCSGMTDRIDTFERSNLFERDTWSRQVADVRRVSRAVDDGLLPGAGLPRVLVGHSRGGATALLAAGRHADDGALSPLAGVVTINAPADCCSLGEGDRAALRGGGFLESPSARTGQTLRVGPDWLLEQEADPAGHDLLDQASRVACPVLVVHGDDDQTVPRKAGTRISTACRQGTHAPIPGGNHVLNTPNPASAGGPHSAPLAAAFARIDEFLGLLGGV